MNKSLGPAISKDITDLHRRDSVLYNVDGKKLVPKLGL